jgi:hypothetical protein
MDVNCSCLAVRLLESLRVGCHLLFLLFENLITAPLVALSHISYTRKQLVCFYFQTCEGMILALENCFGTLEISLNLLAITWSPFGVENCQMVLLYSFSGQNAFITEKLKFKFIISICLL